MTPLAWLALAAALAIGAGAAGSTARVGSLVAVGRLTSMGVGRGTAAGRPTVPALRRPWPLAGVAVGAVAAPLALGGLLLGTAAAAVCGTAWLVGRDLVHGRADAARRRHLLGALRVLIGELEAGARPPAALSAAAEAGPAYAAMFARAASAAAGAHDAGAVLAGEPDTRTLGLAWRLGEETGVALAGVLSRVAADLAGLDEQRRTVAIALAGPRASAGLLAALPLLGIGLGVAMGARPVQFLVGAPAGRAVCCVGVVLDAAGVLWMRRILRRAERR
ncbi:MAG: tight adherence protein [Pseudonocardiales bacterium]|jgi:tight adherence protein B|nr:tight adherence protein [Pseudonocardiales bacterium]